jgi:hypothetical protein
MSGNFDRLGHESVAQPVGAGVAPSGDAVDDCKLFIWRSAAATFGICAIVLFNPSCYLEKPTIKIVASATKSAFAD